MRKKHKLCSFFQNRTILQNNIFDVFTAFRIRKNIRHLSNEELHDLIQAMTKFKQDSTANGYMVGQVRFVSVASTACFIMWLMKLWLTMRLANSSWHITWSRVRRHCFFASQQTLSTTKFKTCEKLLGFVCGRKKLLLLGHVIHEAKRK